jgi:hypothetical protein
MATMSLSTVQTLNRLGEKESAMESDETIGSESEESPCNQAGLSTDEKIAEDVPLEETSLERNVPADETQDAVESSARYCKKCGHELGDGMNFCGVCGTDNTPQPESAEEDDVAIDGEGSEAEPVAAVAAGEADDPEPNNAEATDGITLVEKTAEMAEVEADEPETTNEEKVPEDAPQKPRPSKKVIGIVVGAVALVAAAIAAALILPDTLATPKELFEQQKYEKAFSKATEDERTELIGRLIADGDFATAYQYAGDSEKKNVLCSNLASHVSKDIVESLKDSSSYQLRGMWVSGNTVIFKIEGANSFGGKVTSYWYYTRQDDGSYERQAYISDLDQETIYKWDSASKRKQKEASNLARLIIQKITSNSNDKASDVSIEWTNSLFSNKGFNDVELLSDVSALHSDSGSSSNQS